MKWVLKKRSRIECGLLLAFMIWCSWSTVVAQGTSGPAIVPPASPSGATAKYHGVSNDVLVTPSAVTSTLTRYFDPAQGSSSDDLVRRALTSNGELVAVRLEIERARARLRQAGLRPNPTL